MGRGDVSICPRLIQARLTDEQIACRLVYEARAVSSRISRLLEGSKKPEARNREGWGLASTNRLTEDFFVHLS